MSEDIRCGWKLLGLQQVGVSDFSKSEKAPEFSGWRMVHLEQFSDFEFFSRFLSANFSIIYLALQWWDHEVN